MARIHQPVPIPTPFVLMVHHKAPHRNWVPGPEEMELFHDRVWPEPSNLFDDYVGRSQAAADARMQIGDHMYFDNDLLAPAKPNEFMSGSLETSKQRMSVDARALFEKSYGKANADFAKMPFILSWPGKVEPGTRISALTQNIDFLPTFLDLAGAEVPADLHGLPLTPLLSGEEENLRDATYTHFYEDTGEHHAAAYVATRSKTFKLINYYERGFTELYDLTKDPHEMKSVADDPEYAKIRKAMEDRLAELAKQYNNKTPPWGDDQSGAVPENRRVKPGSKGPAPALSTGG